MEKKDKAFVTAIILAAGSGSRMGMDITKQRLTIRGKSILKHTVSAFEESQEVDSIVIVSREDEIEWVKGELKGDFKKLFNTMHNILHSTNFAHILCLKICKFFR